LVFIKEYRIIGYQSIQLTHLGCKSIRHSHSKANNLVFLNKYQSIRSTHLGCKSIQRSHSKANNLVFLNKYQSIRSIHFGCQSILTSCIYIFLCLLTTIHFFFRSTNFTHKSSKKNLKKKFYKVLSTYLQFDYERLHQRVKSPQRSPLY
jgi:hypothetical protein